MLHLANSVGLRTKIFNMSQDNYEFDDELVMQKDVKTDSMNIEDMDYQLTVKTVHALGKSQCKFLCVHNLDVFLNSDPWRI